MGRASGSIVALYAALVAGVSAAELQAPSGAQDEAARSEAASRAYFTDLELLTQDGERVRFYSDVLKDQVVLINFIFTHCEDACPILTHMLTQVHEGLVSRGAKTVRFVSISIDPQRDTPQALKDFARQQHADHDNWFFLTGEPDHVNQVVRRLGQYSPDLEAHSTLLIAGDVRNRHWMKIPPNTPAPAIVERLSLLAGGE